MARSARFLPKYRFDQAVKLLSQTTVYSQEELLAFDERILQYKRELESLGEVGDHNEHDIQRIQSDMKHLQFRRGNAKSSMSKLISISTELKELNHQ